MKFRQRIMLLNSLIISGLIVATVAVLYSAQENRLSQRLTKERHLTLTRLARVCTETLETKSEILLLNDIKLLLEAGPVIEVGLWDLTGRLQVHSGFLKGDYSGVGQKSADPFVLKANASELLIEERLPEASPRAFRLAVPVMYKGRRFGSVAVRYNLDLIEASLNESRAQVIRTFAGAGAAALLLGLLSSLWLASSLSGPIGLLSEAARGIGTDRKGEFPGDERSDEIGELARELEAMAGRLKEVDRVKDRFLHSMSHDMRSPLAVMQSSLHHAEKMLDKDPKSLKEDIEDMGRAVEDLLRFVNNILDLAKLQAGRVKFEFENMDVPGFLDRSRLSFRRLAEARGISLKIDDGAGEGPVKADRERIWQVLSNLVMNAIKFTPEGGTIRVDAKPEGAMVRFSVRDSGSGIPKESLDSVFQRFEQVPSKGRTGGSMPGTGLGLAIVKEIVERHGGTVGVESEFGKGSTFYFDLPKVNA